MWSGRSARKTTGRYAVEYAQQLVSEWSVFRRRRSHQASFSEDEEGHHRRVFIRCGARRGASAVGTVPARVSRRTGDF